MWKVGVLVLALMAGLLFLLVRTMQGPVDAWSERDRLADPKEQAARSSRNRAELVEIPPQRRPRRASDILLGVRLLDADPRAQKYGGDLASLRGNQVLYARTHAASVRATERRLRLPEVNRLLLNALHALATPAEDVHRVRVQVFDDERGQLRAGELSELMVWTWLHAIEAKGAPWTPLEVRLQLEASRDSAPPQAPKFPHWPGGKKPGELVAAITTIRAPSAIVRSLLDLAEEDLFVEAGTGAVYRVSALHWSFP